MIFDSCHQNEEDYEPAENAEGNVLAHDHIEINGVDCTSKSNKGQVIALADYKENKTLRELVLLEIYNHIQNSSRNNLNEELHNWLQLFLEPMRGPSVSVHQIIEPLNAVRSWFGFCEIPVDSCLYELEKIGFNKTYRDDQGEIQILELYMIAPEEALRRLKYEHADYFNCE